MLQDTSGNKYYLDYGPVQMTISASWGNRSLHREILAETERYVHELLKELTECLHVAKRPLTAQGSDQKKLPWILKSMLAAVKAAGDSTLTPMAAVAGAFADAVADYLQKQKATRIIVNNGGDIALRLAGGESIVVGLQPVLTERNCSHTFTITENSDCSGIATSGLNGRGFTRGIASAVTVLAKSSSVADACATSVANCTTVDDPAIVRLPAGALDPQSDIKEQMVTLDCSALKPEAYHKALQGGIAKARQLLHHKIISGAAIFSGPYLSIIPESFATQVKTSTLNPDKLNCNL